jgi:FkbM family methyltransferase
MGSYDGVPSSRERQPVSGMAVACAALVLCGFLLARAEYDALDGRWKVGLGVRRRATSDDVHGSFAKLLESTEKSLDAKMGEHVRQIHADVEKQMQKIEQLVTRPGKNSELIAGSGHALRSAASPQQNNPLVKKLLPAAEVALPQLPEPLRARKDDYWPFTRNENYKIATAKPSYRHDKSQDPAPYQMYIHDPKICQFISGEINKKGSWEPDLTSTILHKLGPASNGRVFLDIGSNIGWFSLAAAAAGHRVIAIDALTTNVELLLRSLEDNPSFKPLVEVFHYAVSSSAGGVAVMRPAPLGAPEQNRANGQVQFGPEREAVALREKDVVYTERVNVTTIDSIIAASEHLRRDRAARIDVVKMDVEGFEARALFGAMKFLDQHKPCFIVSEFVTRHITSTTAGRMIHDLLMSEGYRINGKLPTSKHDFGEDDRDIYAVHMDPRCTWA